MKARSKAERHLNKAGMDPFGIRWLVDRMHVATPDHEVEAEMRRRMKNWKPGTDHAPTEEALEELKDAVVQYAKECHARNFIEYAAVMSGRGTFGGL